MAYEYVLPEEIIESIFIRMPTKPLLRLKCLSKHWNRVISDPGFMKLRSRRMILLPVLPFHAIDLTDEMTYEMIKLPFPFGNLKDKDVTVVGTLNGIFFLVLREEYYSDDMILYNPFTGAFKIVPKPHLKSLYHCYAYGFCYGTTPDDLKIVRIKKYSDSDSDMKSCRVFSLKNTTWCTSARIGGYHIFDKAGTFVNGFLYWTARKKLLLIILALDVKEMVFSEIQIPHGYMLVRLGTFKGLLCMICTKNDGVEYQIRVMNEHGVGKSWSTVCSFNVSLISNYTKALDSMCILDDGKCVILKRPNQVIIFDMLKHSYKEVNILESLGKIPRLNSTEYVESLIDLAI